MRATEQMEQGGVKGGPALQSERQIKSQSKSRSENFQITKTATPSQFDQCGLQKRKPLLVGGGQPFYWAVPPSDIVNSGREKHS